MARADAFLTSLVSQLDAALPSGGAASLTGAPAPQALDRAIARAAYEPLALLFPPAGALAAAHPRYAAWAAATFTDAEFARGSEAAGQATGGCVRVGGQVDIRSSPEDVSRRADASVERNVGQKKGQSQRASEDAAKEGGGGARAAAAAPQPRPAAASAAGASGGGGAGAAAPRALEQSPATLERNRALAAAPGEARMASTLAALAAAGIALGATHRHAAAFKVPELEAALAGVPGTRCKNLFLKAKKERAPGDSKLWLVVADAASETDLNTIAKTLGYAKDGVRFADEGVLRDHLGIVPGHVSPFSLLNDAAGCVNLVLDASLAGKGQGGALLFHPGTNDASCEIGYEALLKLAVDSNHAPTLMAFGSVAGK